MQWVNLWFVSSGCFNSFWVYRVRYYGSWKLYYRKIYVTSSLFVKFYNLHSLFRQILDANTRHVDPEENFSSDAHIPEGMYNPKLGLFKKYRDEFGHRLSLTLKEPLIGYLKMFAACACAPLDSPPGMSYK